MNGSPEDVPQLNLAAYLPRSTANGPGVRSVLWLQGCDLRCPGCFNPDYLAVRPNRRFAVDVVADAISRVNGVEGVTYSGGEPTLQAAALAALSARLRRRGLSVVCYSGHRLEELEAAGDPDVRALLGQLDILIDGPYERSRAPGGRWRGSANQRLLALTERYRSLCEAHDAGGPDGADAELHVGSGGITWTGIFPIDVVRRVEGLLVRTPGPDDVRTTTGGGQP